VGAAQGFAKVPVLAMASGRPVPITIDGACSVSADERYAHCARALASGLPVLTSTRDVYYPTPCVLVGSGPSAVKLLPEIKARYTRGEEIIALKGAHDWLLKNGVVPRAAIALDPQQSRAKCFKRPHREVLYLCASQMHPDTWEHLRGYKVLIWHSRIEEYQHDKKGWEKAYLVPNLSTTGNSALCLMYLFGRRHFELYGFDSSIPQMTSWLSRLAARIFGRPLKLDGARVPPGDQIVEVVAGEKIFQTTAALVQQAIELPQLLEQLPGKYTVNAHGDGYYQALLAEGKAMGWPV
jgi:uncharacterized Rossmann fold enzyme